MRLETSRVNLFVLTTARCPQHPIQLPIELIEDRLIPPSSKLLHTQEIPELHLQCTLVPSGTK